MIILSMGYAGAAKLIDSDETLLLYAYYCYNLNIHEQGYREIMYKQDGEIYIEKSTLLEPLIRHKIKRLPSGRKKILEKKVIQQVDVVGLYKDGKIKIKNASGTWNVLGCGMDSIARHLCTEIYSEYQETGEIPSCVGFYC